MLYTKTQALDNSRTCSVLMNCYCYSFAKSCLILGILMDCSLPGSSVHEIFQAKVLEWIAISFSKESS